MNLLGLKDFKDFEYINTKELYEIFKNTYNVKFNGTTEDLEVFRNARFEFSEYLSNLIIKNIEEMEARNYTENEVEEQLKHYEENKFYELYTKEYRENFTKRSGILYYGDFQKLQKELEENQNLGM